MKVRSNLDGNRQAKINDKMMLKFDSSMSADGVKILLGVGNRARRQGKCIKF